MKNNKILNKIQSGEVKMKPRWSFMVIKWGEIGMWLLSIAVVVMGIMSISYFMTIYSIEELNEFGDLGWQIFYEDFPYYWGITVAVFLIVGTFVLLKTGNNYKRSWQKNLMITGGIILILTIVSLFLKH